jgi:antitoxin component YwqK of YwqJK toxin-antitoxin module
MKRILAPILLLTLLFPSLAYGVTMDDLVVREGIHYKKFSDVPFTGKTTGKTQGTFRNGKREGPWVSYHRKGQLWEKGTYRDGKREGPWVSYHQNGKLQYKGTYKDGKRHGLWEESDGKGQYRGYYKNGKKEGIWKKLSKEKRRLTITPAFIEPGTYKDGVKVK